MAHADDRRDRCADRPGRARRRGARSITASSPGRGGLVGLSHDRNAGSIEGDLIARAISRALAWVERELGSTGPPAAWSRSTRATGGSCRAHGSGDVTIGRRRNRHNPDGSGFSIAVQPFATLPTGGHAIGAGSWGAGLIVRSAINAEHHPARRDPRVDAAPDEIATAAISRKARPPRSAAGDHVDRPPRPNSGRCAIALRQATAASTASTIGRGMDPGSRGGCSSTRRHLSPARPARRRASRPLPGWRGSSEEAGARAARTRSLRPSPRSASFRRRSASSPSAASRTRAPRSGGRARG